MKKLLPILCAVLAFVACAAFSLLFNAPEGVALAAFVPLMPRNLFSGAPLLNRAVALNDGTWGQGGETLHYPVYDRMRMLNSLGVAARSLFKTAVGAQRENVQLTYADTNIEKSESVPSAQKWTFWKFSVSYLAEESRTDLEIQAILNYFRTTTVRLILNSKDDMFRLPLWKFLGASQIVTAPAATINSRSPGALFTGVMELKVPIVLQSLTDWELRVEPLVASAAGLDNDFIGFEFDGERTRLN
jgi:hypothetical protein